MQKFLHILLWPFAQLYGGIMRLRNFGYTHNLLSSHCFDIPVIAVGNLTVGGTGKTPHVEYLLRLLKHYQVATLSRGYKRKSKGFILAGSVCTAATIGDEPYQYHLDFKDVAVAVCEKRVKGIQELLRLLPNLRVIVLDDAMQHRAVQPSLNILITDFSRPFYSDHVLPAGRLREPRIGAQRADAVVVSKCPPELNAAQRNTIVAKIRMYTTPDTPVFFSTFAYGTPISIGCAAEPSKKVMLLTGIANAEPLKKYLVSQGCSIVEHLSYPDHHQYTLENLSHLQNKLQKSAYAGATVFTTRKDAVKLMDAELQPLASKLPIFYVPIEVQLLDNQEDFNQLVLEHVQRMARY